MNYPQIDGLSFSFSYVEPREPPASGAEWSEETDYPGVRVEVVIRARKLAALIGGKLFGEEITKGQWDEGRWGAGTEYVGSEYVARSRSVTRYAKTLEQAEAECVAYLKAELDALYADVVRKRDQRMAQREATITAAHARCGSLVKPPSP